MGEDVSECIDSLCLETIDYTHTKNKDVNIKWLGDGTRGEG